MLLALGIAFICCLATAKAEAQRNNSGGNNDVEAQQGHP